MLLDGGFCVQDLGEVERDLDMNIGRGGCVASNIFEEKFGFPVDDEDEFREIGRKSSAKDIFLTLAMDFLTEAPALEHRFQNSARPNCEVPVLRSL